MKFIILGCGSSMGVPRPDGFFGNCDPKNKKNYRTRCSAFLKTKNENILFDTSPDLRAQLLKNKLNKVDKVLYSHQHADQTHGINDLRAFFIKKREQVPIYGDKKTLKYLTDNFSYCFKKTNTGYPPILKLNVIKSKLLIDDGNKKITIKSFKVKHGNVESVCYIIDKKLAYISDVKEFYKKDYQHLKNLKYLIIDCLRPKYHPSHMNLDETLEIIKILGPKKTILTNLHSDFDYSQLKKILPKNIMPAYDGLSLNL